MSQPVNNARKNGKKAFISVKRVLDDVGWDAEETELEGQLVIDFQDSELPITTVEINIKIDYERLVCYFNFKDIVGKNDLDEIEYFISSANSGMIIGNFEIDKNTGKIRFKSSLDFTGVDLEERLIRNVIRSAMDVVEDYGDAAAEVIKGKKDAATAIAEVES